MNQIRTKFCYRSRCPESEEETGERWHLIASGPHPQQLPPASQQHLGGQNQPGPLMCYSRVNVFHPQVIMVRPYADGWRLGGGFLKTRSVVTLGCISAAILNDALWPGIYLSHWQLESNFITLTLNDRHGVSNHRSMDCLFTRLFRPTTKKHQRSALLSFCEWKSPLPARPPVVPRKKGQ